MVTEKVTTRRPLDEVLMTLDSRQTRSDLPSFKAGDTVKVHFRIREGEKERVQVFQGVVIAARGSGLQKTFTVRKVSYGVGVERTFPFHSPLVAKVEVVRLGKVRRGKIFYVRDLKGKAARIPELRVKSDKGSAGRPKKAKVADESSPTEAVEVEGGGGQEEHGAEG